MATDCGVGSGSLCFVDSFEAKAPFRHLLESGSSESRDSDSGGKPVGRRDRADRRQKVALRALLSGILLTPSGE
jgi:hypothetical protein